MMQCFLRIVLNGKVFVGGQLDRLAITA